MSTDPSRRGHPAEANGAAEEQRAALREGWRRTRLSLEAFWLSYYALGGDADLLEVEAYLQQLVPLPTMEREVLAHALNEHAMELRAGPAVSHDRVLTPSPTRRGAPAAAPSPMAVLIARLAQEADEDPASAV